MKKLLSVIIIVITFCFSASAQFEGSKQVYEKPNMKSIIARHKKVAILPLIGQISYKRMPKNFNAEANKEEEKKMGLNLQEGMYTYLMRKADDYFVEFQDISRTNILLKQAGVFDKLDEVTPDSIAKILKVDAVILSNFTYEKTGSEGGAIVAAVLLGVNKGTATGTLTLKIYDGKDGDLLWRFYKEMNEGAFSSANEVMERMMRKLARNFPYTN